MTNNQAIIQKLKQAARDGMREIEDGDVYRPQLTDVVYDEIVPESEDDQVLAMMAESGEWMRCCAGFYLRDLLKIDECAVWDAEWSTLPEWR